jgi:peptidoglycan/LPS O-acetylase OafA/YrhL
MQFYALAPFLAALGRRSVWIFALVVLAAGAVMSRPWGGFWWTLRPDGLLVGVLLGVETRWGAAWIDRAPKIGIGLATYWLLVAAILARVTSSAGSGVGLAVVAAIFGMVVAGNRGASDDGEGRGSAAALRWIGERSFSIYLVHLPILSGVRAVLHDRAPVGVVMVLATLAAVLAALCLEGFVTRPSVVLGRRLSARLCEFRAGKIKLRMEGSSG